MSKLLTPTTMRGDQVMDTPPKDGDRQHTSRSATFMPSTPAPMRSVTDIDTPPKGHDGIASRNDTIIPPRSVISVPSRATITDTPPQEPELVPRPSCSSDKLPNQQSHVAPTPGSQLTDTKTSEVNARRSAKYHETVTRLAGLCQSDRVIHELALLPDPESFTSVPEYFHNGKLCVDLLPPYLKGLSIDLDQSHLTEAEVNLLIFYCCVHPEERDKLFNISDAPGACKDFKVIVDISDKTLGHPD